MKMLRTLALAVVAVLATMTLTTSFPNWAIAQVPSDPGPYNTDTGVLITNTLRTAGSVQTASQTNLSRKGVVCTYNQSANSGTSSVTFSIQQFDAASNSWFTLVTSGAITANATPTPIGVYPGAQTASLPSGMVMAGLHIPRVWRVSQTVGGSGGPAVTGTVGCNLLN